MEANSKMTFDDIIVFTQVLDDDRLATCDLSQHFSIYNLHTAQREHAFNFKQAYVQNEKRTIAFSPDGKYIAFSEKEQSVVRVINIQKQSIHHSFATAQNRVETLCFDPSSRYLVAGCVTGRVFLWNLFSTGQVSRLSSFPEYSPSMLALPKTNYVSAICFSPKGDYVATTGYGGSIVITNIHTEVSPKRITPKHTRIDALHFIDETLLAAGNIEGGLDIIDTKESQILKHFQTNLGSISTLFSSNSATYLFAVGKGRQVTLLNLKTLKIVKDEYLLLNAKISSISLNKEDNLIVACEDASIQTFDLFPQDKLQLYIDTGAYHKAYALLHEYPLLQESPLADELNDIWEEHLSQAIIMVEMRQGEEVEKILKSFSKMPSKSTIMQDFNELISHFERFKLALHQGNLALAYSMAEHVKLLKKTSVYEEMENAWNKAFLKAQACVIRDNTHLLFKTLEPYAKVSVKLCFIQVLLHNPELFLEFVQHINSREYEKIFSITQKYPCLKEIESFQNIVITVNDLSNKCKQHILSSQYDLAELELKELSYIPYMRQTLHELERFLNLCLRFDKLYEKDKLLEAYELIDKNEKLLVLENVQKLEKQWRKKIQKAEEEALLGHTKNIKNILGSLVSLSTRSQKVGMLLRQSYLTQIKLLLIKHRSSLVNQAIHNYIAIFSYDSELDNLITKIKKDKLAVINLNEEQKQRRPRSLWLQVSRGILPDTILQTKASHV